MSDPFANDELISKMAEIGARSAWSLHRWDVMDSFVQLIPVRRSRFYSVCLLLM